MCVCVCVCMYVCACRSARPCWPGGTTSLDPPERHREPSCRVGRILVHVGGGQVGGQDDGGVHSPRHGLRCDLPNGGCLHGTREQARSGPLQPVCGRMRGMRSGVRAAYAGTLPGLWARVPHLCRGVSENGECACSGTMKRPGHRRPMMPIGARTNVRQGSRPDRQRRVIR